MLFLVLLAISSTIGYHLPRIQRKAAIAEEQIAQLIQKTIEQEELLRRYEMVLNLALPEWKVEEVFFSKTVEVSIYTSRVEETDKTPWTTANNTIVRPGGIAVSRDLLQEVGGFGAMVILRGYGVFMVNDVMNPRYKDTVDIWAGDLIAARKHGRQTATLHWQ